MAFDEHLATFIRASLKHFPTQTQTGFSEKKLFGGLPFLWHGKMTVGILKDDLMVRIVPGKMEAILKNPHVRPMNFTKRPMKEFIFVGPVGFKNEEALQVWIALGVEHARQKLK